MEHHAFSFASPTVKTRHYGCGHLQLLARSIIFLEKPLWLCTPPRGGPSAGENRSGGMTVSSDLITSGAKSR